MLKNLLGPKKEDICPNCGTRCFATDALCPNCGKNLDELYEQLPDDWPKAKPLITLRAEHKFLLAWVAATSVGMALGEVYLGPFAYQLIPSGAVRGNFDFFRLLLGLASDTATGIAIGSLQWLILRKHLSGSWTWIVATILGMAAASPVQWLFFAALHRYWPAILEHTPIDRWIGYFLVGAVLGLSQWLVLRRSLQRAWTWVPFSGAGWTLGLIVGFDLVYQSFAPPSIVGFVDWTLTSLGWFIVYGSVGTTLGIETGAALLWLFRKDGRKLGGHMDTVPRLGGGTGLERSSAIQ